MLLYEKHIMTFELCNLNGWMHTIKLMPDYYLGISYDNNNGNAIQCNAQHNEQCIVNMMQCNVWLECVQKFVSIETFVTAKPLLFFHWKSSLFRRHSMAYIIILSLFLWLSIASSFLFGRIFSTSIRVNVCYNELH